MNLTHFFKEILTPENECHNKLFLVPLVAPLHVLFITLDSSEKFIPMTRTNMCYICGAVIFDESGKVLMIQEAKKGHRGEWYLPIGRLERNETILVGLFLGIWRFVCLFFKTLIFIN